MDREWLLPDLSRAVSEAAVVDSSWVARPIREYGSLDGPLQFGFPYAVAILPDGAIAVADADECAFVVVERPSGRRRGQWGQCGDGPGEFRFIRAVASTRDSLFVYDQGRSDVAVWSLAGREARRVPVRGPNGGYFTLSHIDVLDDTTWVVSTESPGHASLGLMDSRTGAWRGELVGPPRIAALGDPPIRHMGGSCMRPSPDDPLVVLVSEWALEGVGLDPYGRTERFHYLTDLGFPPKRRADAWRSGLWGTEIRCGESLALGRAATLAPEDSMADMRTVRADMVVLEARDYQGKVLMRQWVDDRESPLRAVPAAFAGDTLFAVSHNIRTFPFIAEIVFEPRTRASTPFRSASTMENKHDGY